MQRKLSIVLAVVMLLSLMATAAYAEPNEPTAPEGYFLYAGGERSLGDLVSLTGFTFDPLLSTGDLLWVLPYHPYESWLYRPDTVYGVDDVWGFDPRVPGQWDLDNEYIKPVFDSSLRRQLEGSGVSNAFGVFQIRFMLPRNAAETWYPCGFPCKWQCNYFDPINGWEFHSPMGVRQYIDENTYVRVLPWRYPDYRFTKPPKPYWPPPLEVMTYYPLFWPWAGYDYGQDPAAAYQFDTVHPLEWWVVEPVHGYAMHIAEIKVVSTDWQPTDTTVDDYLLEWPYICGYDFPDPDNLGTPYPWGW